MTAVGALGLGWLPSSFHGWGIFGLNFAHTLMAEGLADPLFFEFMDANYIDPNDPRASVMATILRRSRTVRDALDLTGQRAPFPVIRAMGNQFVAAPSISGTPDHAAVFLEDTNLHADRIEVMQAYERIVAGSTWLADLLRDRGLRQAVPVLQGVDRTRFSMSQPRTPSRSNFVVFSGGKMEFRKGQDIVISAFKIFRSRHPDARLHFSWDNIFAGQAATIGLRGLVTSAPEVRPETRHLVDGWLEANGLPPGSFRNLGLMGNQRIGEALADVHVAVFANRCEGGTNLVAMECMALGIPTILSANSGHLDLIDGDNCYALRRQGPVDSGPLRFGTSGWGESSVEELADCLELVYTQYAAAIERGRRGADTMKELNWSKQTRRLLQAIDWPVVVR